jgi:hypothetical protein
MLMEAHTSFLGILNISSFDEITEDFVQGGKNYKVYKKGVIFPESYHLRMLAYSDQWKNGNERLIILNGIKKLIELSPLQDVRVKHKSRWLAPAGICPSNLGIDLCDLATEGWNGNWAQWFHTFELFARMGIVKEIPELKKQAEQLKDLLDEGDGFFIHNFKEEYFNGWSIYHGLALENDWKQGRGIYDLTFRALLILHLSGLLY